MRPRLYSLVNAYVVMGGGDDGAVITEGLESVSELCAFTQLGQKPRPVGIEQALHPEILDEAVVGVDGACSNYYHWLTNALARSRLCTEAIGSDTPILLPDFNVIADTPGRVKASVLQASTSAILGARACRLLCPGVYRVRRLHVLWTRPTAPTDIAGLERFYDLFDEVAQATAPPRAKVSRRIYLSRRGAHDERLPAGRRELLDALLDENGFEALDLANMAFDAQVRAAADAELIVAPHGAGMTNLLFSPREARVIELTSRLGSEKSYRPWYYQLCDGRGQPYGAIDVGRPGWLDDLAAAVRG